MRLDVFGRDLEVVRDGDRWRVLYLGGEGKKRPAPELVVPAQLREDEVIGYLADLCHEWARPGHDTVRRIDRPE